jgi:hypothetical protein
VQGLWETISEGSYRGEFGLKMKAPSKGNGKDARIIIEIEFRGWGLGIRSKP